MRLKARAVEGRLKADSWSKPSYDLVPQRAALRIPALVMFGDRDFIPGEIAQHIATAIPSAPLVTFSNCGHFSYLECPSDGRVALDTFFRSAKPAGVR